MEAPTSPPPATAGSAGVLRPVYSDTTQLDVELSYVGEVSIATPTQLNLTRRRVVDTFTA